MQIATETLSHIEFVPFGQILEAPLRAGRAYFDEALRNGRTSAWPSLSIVHTMPVQGSELHVQQLERHEHSSQSFVPMESGRWLVVVCPMAPGGGPDVSRVKAFVARPDQAVTFHANTWHLGLHVLDRPASHVIFMWRDKSAGDETFVDVSQFTIKLPV